MGVKVSVAISFLICLVVIVRLGINVDEDVASASSGVQGVENELEKVEIKKSDFKHEDKTISYDMMPVIYHTNERITSVRLRIVNNSQASLVLKPIKASCGCTSARVDVDKLEAGDSAMLESEIKLDGRKVSRFISIPIETGGGQSLMVKVKVPLIPVIRFSNEAIHLGALQPSTIRQQRIDVITSSVNSNAMVRIINAKALNPFTEIKSLKKTTEPNDFGIVMEKHLFDVIVRPMQPGVYDTKLAFEWAEANSNMKLKKIIPLRFSVDSGFNIMPNRLVLLLKGSLDNSSKELTKELKLSRSSPFSIIKVNCTESSISVKAAGDPLKNQKSHQIVVSVDRSEVKDPIQGEVTVKTDVVNEPEFTFPVSVIPTGLN